MSYTSTKHYQRYYHYYIINGKYLSNLVVVGGVQILDNTKTIERSNTAITNQNPKGQWTRNSKNILLFVSRSLILPINS